MLITGTNEASQLISQIYRLSLEADKTIRPHIHLTPLTSNYTLSKIVGRNVYLKLENMQKTGSFKVRGALFKIYKLIETYKDQNKQLKGVVAASSGNHAQGVAYAAKIFGIKAIIVMPKTASSTKINATRNYGAEVVLHGEIYDEAYMKALEIARDKRYEFIHPYDDPAVMAGQGTIGHEILRQINDPHSIIVPIGGGGLISGIAVALKKQKQNIRVIGVQPWNASSMYHLIAKKTENYVPRPSIADGVVVKKPGKLTSMIVEELVDDIVIVDEEDISYAINFLLERAKIIAEGAGALSVAALLSGRYTPIKGPVISLISGGNIDPTLLSRIIIHELAKDGRLVTIVGEIPDKPGQLGNVIAVLAKYGLNIVDIRHDRWDPKMLPSMAKLEIVFEAKTRDDVDNALKELETLGYKFKRRD